MSVSASLVIGADGATVKNGTSAGVSNLRDRERFLARRSKFDCILIGGNTYRNENYQNTPVPLFVISKKGDGKNLTPTEAIKFIKKTYGENILVEAGPALLTEMIKDKLIDDLYLTITDVTGGDEPISFVELLRSFIVIDDEVIDGTRFITASKAEPHRVPR